MLAASMRVLMMCSKRVQHSAMSDTLEYRLKPTHQTNNPLAQRTMCTTLFAHPHTAAALCRARAVRSASLWSPGLLPPPRTHGCSWWCRSTPSRGRHLIGGRTWPSSVAAAWAGWAPGMSTPSWYHAVGHTQGRWVYNTRERAALTHNTHTHVPPAPRGTSQIKNNRGSDQWMCLDHLAVS